MKKRLLTLLVITSLCAQAPAHAGWLDASSFITSAYNAAKNNTYAVLSAAAVLSGAGIGYWYLKKFYKPSTPPTRPDAPAITSSPTDLFVEQCLQNNNQCYQAVSNTARNLLTREQRTAAFAQRKQELRTKAEQRQAELKRQEAVTEPVEEEISTAHQPSTSNAATCTENPPRTTKEKLQDGLRAITAKREKSHAWESQVPQSGGSLRAASRESASTSASDISEPEIFDNNSTENYNSVDTESVTLPEIARKARIIQKTLNTLFKDLLQLEKAQRTITNKTFKETYDTLRKNGLLQPQETRISQAIERVATDRKQTIEKCTLFLKKLTSWRTKVLQEITQELAQLKKTLIEQGLDQKAIQETIKQHQEEYKQAANFTPLHNMVLALNNFLARETKRSAYFQQFGK